MILPLVVWIKSSNLKFELRPNSTNPLIIETVETNITSLRMRGKMIDRLPPLFKGLIIVTIIKVMPHHKIDEIEWIPWISILYSPIKTTQNNFFSTNF